LNNISVLINTINQNLEGASFIFTKNTQTAGRKSTSWDGKDDMGNKVAGGMYLCQIHAGNFIQTKKLMLLK
jgi:flagellar hook assembly protein FlgD|tara:strand:- start:67 stop:279 length:213 start_codon:yes stop_codon:yes gene_type:complete